MNTLLRSSRGGGSLQGPHDEARCALGRMLGLRGRGLPPGAPPSVPARGVKAGSGLWAWRQMQEICRDVADGFEMDETRKSSDDHDSGAPP